MVVVAEAFAALMLISMSEHSVARFAPAVILLVVFSIAVASSGSARSVVSCHCFGAATALPVWLHLLLNGMLAGLGLAAMVSAAGPAPTAADWLLGAGVGAILGVLVVAASPLHAALAIGPTTRQGSGR